MKRPGPILVLGALACTSQPERPPDAPPDLLVVALAAGWSAVPPAPVAPHVAHFPASRAVHTESAPALRALLTGQWPGTTATSVPNTLHGVLKLYGYRAVGRLPTDLVPAETPWLSAGLDPEPLAGHACLADQLDVVADLRPGPRDEAVAAVLVPDGAGCATDRDHAALGTLLTGPGSAHRITVVVGLGAADPWNEAGGPVPFFIAGPGLSPTPVDGFGSVVDVVPTLLPLADAVVPSDAIGTDLTPVLAGAAPGPDLLFQQDGDGRVGVRTTKHLLSVVAGDAPLPETPPDAVQYQPLAGNTDPLDTVRGPLYTALLQWDRQRRATSAAERMGSGAFREMLRDQGYWH